MSSTRYELTSLPAGTVEVDGAVMVGLHDAAPLHQPIRDGPAGRKRTVGRRDGSPATDVPMQALG